MYVIVDDRNSLGSKFVFKLKAIDKYLSAEINKYLV